MGSPKESEEQAAPDISSVEPIDKEMAEENKVWGKSIRWRSFVEGLRPPRD